MTQHELFFKNIALAFRKVLLERVAKGYMMAPRDDGFWLAFNRAYTQARTAGYSHDQIEVWAREVVAAMSRDIL